MPEWIEYLLNNYGYLIVFLVVFLNNAGIPVPGDTFLLGAGFLVQSGMLYLGWTVASGTLACFLGGLLGYWVGRRGGRKFLLRNRFFRITPEKMDQVERFIKRKGAKAVFFARFVALLHPVTGILSGVGKLPFLPFLIWNLAGSVAYALVYTLLGYFFGESWDMLKVWLGRTAIYTFAAVVVLASISWIIRKPLGLILKEQK